MAVQLWTIKKSEGKGLGVFALQDMEPGTIILVEEAAFTVGFPATARTLEDLDAYTMQLFSRLTKHEQEKLLDLHPGPQLQYKGFCGTWHANAFGDADRQSQSIYLNLSRVNHSCVPNATVCSLITPDALTTTKWLIVDKPIKAGEEIHICYTPWYEAMPTRFRAKPMLERYGFVCSCPACTLPLTQARLSDARRSIIGAIKRALDGYKPDDFIWLENLREPLPPGYPDEIHPTQRLEHLDQPLSVMQQTAYNFLLGACRAAEGVDLYPALNAYLSATMLLFEQIMTMDDIVVLESVDLLRQWVESAIGMMGRIRGKDYFETVGLRDLWKNDMESVPRIKV